MDAAMNSAVSALQAQQAALSTVSDNLANSQTSGYKAVTTEFNSLLTQEAVGLAYPSGGVSATAQQNVLAQGLVQSSASDLTTNMGITGNGMFVVSNGLGGGQFGFTRNGDFEPDQTGNLFLAGTNNYLLGWQTDAKGNILGANPDNIASLQNVNINKFNNSATATTSYSLQANLPAEAQSTDTTVLTYSANPATAPADVATGTAVTLNTAVTTNESLSLAYTKLSANPGGSPPTTTYQLTVTSSNPDTTITDTTNSISNQPGTPLVYQVTVDNSGNITQINTPANFATSPATPGTTLTAPAGGPYLTLPTFNTDDEATPGTAIATANSTWSDLGSAAFTQNTSFSIYDSLGVQQSFPISWSAEGDNQWVMTVNSPTNPAGTSSTGQLYDANGNAVSSYSYNVSFNSDGTLNSISPISNSFTDPVTGLTTTTTAPMSGTNMPALSATWNDGAQAQVATSGTAISVNLGTGGPLGTGTTNGLSQFDTGETSPAIAVKATNQNGIQYGQLTGVSIDSTTGNVIASYDNGQKVPIYKIPVATFPNENGLTAGNNGIYQQSALSGTYTLNPAGTNGAGSITGQALEQSNVDTSTEFSNMITAQQAYSSASQVISTDKQMFTSLIQVIQ